MDYVSHEVVPSYPFVPIKLPETATPKQLMSALNARGDFQRSQINSFKIVKARKVNDALSGEFTAILLDTDMGPKVVLVQHLNSRNKSDGWYWKIYDTK